MEEKYAEFKSPGLTGIVVKTGSDCVFDPVSLIALPDDPDRCCKKGNTVQAGVNGTFFVKRFAYRTFWNSFRHLFKLSRPRHCLRAAEKLTASGIDTPRVFGALRKFRNKLPQADYLITEDISSAAVFADKMPPGRQLLRETCLLLARMHEAGIEHGDVSLRNLYQKNDGTWGVIDLDACRMYSLPLPHARRRRELARLASSFIKIRQIFPNSEKLPPDIAQLFAQEYQKITRIDLNDFRYRKRVRYLAGRKRK